MFEWLLLVFFAPVTPHVEPTKKEHYVGVVAAEAAYTAMLPDKEEVKPAKPIDPNCPTCHGTGKVKSGDQISWTKCPTCQAAEQTPAATTPAPKAPVMKLQVKPLPAPTTGACPTGKCPYTRS